MNSKMSVWQRFADEIFNQKNLELVQEIFSANHSVNGKFLGQEKRKQMLSRFHGAFPDSNIAIDNQFEIGDRVVTRWVFTGTDQGGFQCRHPPADQSALAESISSISSRGK